MELLRSDKRVLKRAADLPLIFRVPVAVNGKSARFGGRFKPRRFRGFVVKGRWGARPLTRLYVETHVRRQLEAIRACLRLELLGTTAVDDLARIEALDAELVRRVPPLLGCRRLRALLVRLPALSAAVPVVWAASILLPDDFSIGSAWEALVLLAVTALGVWLLVVWPAVKLGFRVKRAIFAGGRDVAHPFLYHRNDNEIRWETLTGYAPTVYAAEDKAFEAFGRRKPGEHPLDLLLSFVPYIWFAVLVLFIVFFLQAAWTGFEGLTWASLFNLLIVPLIIVTPFRYVRNAVRNSRERPH